MFLEKGTRHRSWGQTGMTPAELGQWHTHAPCLLLCSCPPLWPSQPQISALLEPLTMPEAPPR